MKNIAFVVDSWRSTLSVATAFWAICLVLVSVEAMLGSNVVVGGLFFLSIPLLVAGLTWVNKGIVFNRPRRSFGSVVILGAAVLAFATFIILVGLLAAANLKFLITSA